MIRTTDALVPALAFTLTLSACDSSERRVVLGGAIDLSATTIDTAVSANVRRVWSQAGDYASPSPDGRFVTFVDWSTGDVAMHEIASGEDRRLTDKGTWHENGGWAEEPLFSPDGREVVYSFGNVRIPNGFQYELRIVAVDDTTQRTILTVAPNDEWVHALDWSASRGILVEINRDSAREYVTELALVDPATGVVRVLKTVPAEGTHPHDAFVSPEGRYVAYREGRSLRMVAADGTADRSLGVDVRWLLGWAPGGEGLLVHASAESATGIWFLPIADGRRAGEPRLVRGGMTAFQPGGLAGSSYYYKVPVDEPRVFVTSVDLETGRVLSPPVAVTSPVQGAGRMPVWSPDGRTLAYGLFDASENVTRIMLRASDGDEVRELAAVERDVFPAPVWAPDGRALYAGIRKHTRRVIARFDVRTGEVREVFDGFFRGLAVAPDGRLIFAKGQQGGQPNTPGQLVAHDLETGEEQILFETMDRLRQPGTVSPDGSALAVVLGAPAGQTTRVMIIPLDGGPAREIARSEYPVHWETNRRVSWSPDSRYVVVERGGWEGIAHQLMAIPVDGGDPVLAMDAQASSGHVLHPDGRRLVYVEGESRAEMWVLDDLTPEGR